MFAHLFVLVNHSEWNVSTHSVSSRRVGEGTQTVRAWVRGTWFPHLGVCEDVAEGQFLPCGCGADWSLSWRCWQRSGHPWACSVRNWQWGVYGFNFWGVTHSCGMLQRVSGERVYARTVGLSNFWRQVAQTLPPKTASTVFGVLGPFSVTEFIVTRLKGAEHRDWMQSRQSLRRAIETCDPSLPGLVDVVSNIIGVWPLIVPYLKETGKKDSGDSLVVWFSSLSFCFNITATAYFRFHVYKKGIDGFFYIDQLGRRKFHLFHVILKLCW